MRLWLYLLAFAVLAAAPFQTAIRAGAQTAEPTTRPSQTPSPAAETATEAGFSVYQVPSAGRHEIVPLAPRVSNSAAERPVDAAK